MSDSPRDAVQTSHKITQSLVKTLAVKNWLYKTKHFLRNISQTLELRGDTESVIVRPAPAYVLPDNCWYLVSQMFYFSQLSHFFILAAQLLSVDLFSEELNRIAAELMLWSWRLSASMVDFTVNQQLSVYMVCQIWMDWCGVCFYLPEDESSSCPCHVCLATAIS